MSLAYDSSERVLSVPQKRLYLVPTPGEAPGNGSEGAAVEEDVALTALQAHFGQQVNAYRARLREDYAGPASNKVKVGGALVIDCVLTSGEGIGRQRLVVDADHRPLPEEAIAELGAIAEVSRRDPVHPQYIISDLGGC